MAKKTKDKREPEWKKQRKKWGFDERELWSLDSTIAKFIAPRLKKYKECPKSYPCSLAYDENGNIKKGRKEEGYCKKTEKEWNKMLDKMIFSFENYELIHQHDTETNKKIDEGIKLFAEYFSALWW